jgi:hypothetical protein
LDHRPDVAIQREALPEKPGGDVKAGTRTNPANARRDDKPSRGRDARLDPRNDVAPPPPGTPTAVGGASSSTKDRWGDLPQKVRDLFRAEGGSELPVQYRQWIDAYYRRLNRER